MRKYDVMLTEEAKQDRKSLARFIKEEVHAPRLRDICSSYNTAKDGGA